RAMDARHIRASATEDGSLKWKVHRCNRGAGYVGRRLLRLVLYGKKSATGCAERQGLLSAEVGKLMVVLDGQDVPKAATVTILMPRPPCHTPQTQLGHPATFDSAPLLSGISDIKGT